MQPSVIIIVIYIYIAYEECTLKKDGYVMVIAFKCDNERTVTNLTLQNSTGFFLPPRPPSPAYCTNKVGGVWVGVTKPHHIIKEDIYILDNFI